MQDQHLNEIATTATEPQEGMETLASLNAELYRERKELDEKYAERRKRVAKQSNYKPVYVKLEYVKLLLKGVFQGKTNKECLTLLQRSSINQTPPKDMPRMLRQIRPVQVKKALSALQINNDDMKNILDHSPLTPKEIVDWGETKSIGGVMSKVRKYNQHVKNKIANEQRLSTVEEEFRKAQDDIAILKEAMSMNFTKEQAKQLALSLLEQGKTSTQVIASIAEFGHTFSKPTLNRWRTKLVLVN